MPPTFCQCEEALDNARGNIIKARTLSGNANSAVVQSDNILAALQTTYGNEATEINAQVGDAAWDALKARLDKMLTERASLKADTACAKHFFAKLVAFGAFAVQAKLDELV